MHLKEHSNSEMVIMMAMCGTQLHTAEVVVDEAWIHTFYDYEIALSFHSVVLPATELREKMRQRILKRNDRGKCEEEMNERWKRRSLYTRRRLTTTLEEAMFAASVHVAFFEGRVVVVLLASMMTLY